jgi:CheY-like chemotaxis protein
MVQVLPSNQAVVLNSGYRWQGHDGRHLAPGGNAEVRPARQEAPTLSKSRDLTVLSPSTTTLVLIGTVGMLEDLGHAAIEAASGQAALEVLRSGEEVDVLVTDQAMPGMTGTELIRAARMQRPGLPVILATGYAEPAGIDRGIPVLKKPLPPTGAGESYRSGAWSLGGGLPVSPAVFGDVRVPSGRRFPRNDPRRVISRGMTGGKAGSHL